MKKLLIMVLMVFAASLTIGANVSAVEHESYRADWAQDKKEAKTSASNAHRESFQGRDAIEVREKVINSVTYEDGVTIEDKQIVVSCPGNEVEISSRTTFYNNGTMEVEICEIARGRNISNGAVKGYKREYFSIDNDAGREQWTRDQLTRLKLGAKSFCEAVVNSKTEHSTGNDQRDRDSYGDRRTGGSIGAGGGGGMQERKGANGETQFRLRDSDVWME